MIFLTKNQVVWIKPIFLWINPRFLEGFQGNCIKLAPHFLEHLQKILEFFKQILVLFQKILVFSQTNDVYSAKILILFKQILFSLNVFCQKHVWSIIFFHQQIFNHTLSGRKFLMHMWMNLMTGGPQVTAKQVD